MVHPMYPCDLMQAITIPNCVQCSRESQVAVPCHAAELGLEKAIQVEDVIMNACNQDRIHTTPYNFLFA